MIPTISGEAEVAAVFIGVIALLTVLMIIFLHISSRNKPVSDIVKHTTEHDSGEQPGKV